MTWPGPAQAGREVSDMIGALDVTAAETGHYLTWGVLSISVANALVIAVMLVVFVLALVVPFGRQHGAGTRRGDRP